MKFIFYTFLKLWILNGIQVQKNTQQRYHLVLIPKILDDLSLTVDTNTHFFNRNSMLNQITSHEVIIDPSRVQSEYLKDLLRYRELFYFLAWRDILVRYKQAFFGVAWALIRPLLNMLMFTLLFNRIANLQSGDVNYSLFVLAAMLPWQLFSNVVGETSTCLLNNANLLTKTYFPRMLLPTALIVVNFLDFIIGIGLLFVLMIAMASLGGSSLLALPAFVLLLLMLSVGVSLWFSALTVKFRDVRFIIPFVIQFGAFLSPVGYSSELITGKLKWLYFLNPLVGIIDGFRWSFFGVMTPDFAYTQAFAWTVTLLVLVTGFFYFRKTERYFADNI